jgi:predicted nucleotidyltransferase
MTTTRKTNFNYKSSNGMLTKVWGPTMWHFLHVMSFNYPDSPTKDDRQHYKQFIYMLGNILPCKYCRINLKKNLKQMPLTNKDLLNRHNFSLYIYKLHEKVNTLLNKKSGLSYNDVRERYEYFRSNCFKEKKVINNKKTKKNKKKNKKEKGCTEPINGEKSKCIINIIPQTSQDGEDSIQIDKRCVI